MAVSASMPVLSAARYCVREAGATAPSLGLAQSFWALQEREVSIAASLEAACLNGFAYFEAGLSEERMPRLRSLLRSFPVRLIAQGWATRADDADAYLERAVELGALCINFHLGHAFLSVAQAVDLVGAVQRKAAALGLPMLLETHRGRLTQDLVRTVEMVRQLPDLALTLDVSHYLVAGEGFGGDRTAFLQHMDALCARAALIHGRISDGQSVQVRSADSLALTEVVQELWCNAMRGWLQHAPKDAVMVFEPELGPPPYAARDGAGRETWSRTEETEALVRLAQQAWRQAQAGQGGTV